MDFFSDAMRRDPYPVYDRLRSTSPLFHVPPPFDAWLIFDYESVNRALNDHDTFSSRVPAPPNWFLFFDPRGTRSCAPSSHGPSRRASSRTSNRVSDSCPTSCWTG